MASASENIDQPEVITWLSSEETAAALGVSVRALQRYRRRMPGEFWRDESVGGRRLYHLEAVLAWKADAVRPAGRPPAGASGRHEEGPVPELAAPREKTHAPAAPVSPRRVGEALERLAGERTGADLELLARQVDLEKKQVELDRRRREEAEAAGLLVERELVVTFWRRQIGVVQERFRALPGALSGRLVDLAYEEIYALLDRELRAVLEGFARPLPLGDGDG